jgi:hypothetical protein
MDPNPDYDASNELECGMNWFAWILRDVYPPPAYPRSRSLLVGQRTGNTVLRTDWKAVAAQAPSGGHGGNLRSRTEADG